MTFLLVTLIICIIVMFIMFIKSGHFIKCMIKSALLSAVAVIIVVFFGNKVGIDFPINAFSLTTSAVLGIPGLSLILILKYMI